MDDKNEKYEELEIDNKDKEEKKKKSKKKFYKKIRFILILIAIIVAIYIIYMKTKQVQSLKKEIEDEKQRREDEKKILMDSKILEEDFEEKDKIRKWINSDVSFQTKLLYRLSRDGSSIFNFHCKCDHISPTLLLIQSHDQNKFGGYTTATWDMFSEIYKNGTKTFLFSLTKNKKYLRKQNTNANDIFSGSRDVGPWFGIHDLYFYGTMNDLYSYKFSGQCAFLDGNGLVDSNNIDNSVVVKEIELYQIIFRQ